MNIKLIAKQYWLWRNNTAWPWIEALIITTLILGFCYILHPDNPLFIHAIFPWPWIAAVIVVLQYGAGPSLISIATICVVAIFMRNSGTLAAGDFQGYFLSGVTLILVCTLFSSSWIRRVSNSEELLTYTNERLNSLSRSYYMLRISYDYLEQNVITKPQTLRLVMEDLQKIVISQNGMLTPDIAYRFLQLVAQYCSITIAGIYLHEKKNISVYPFAEIGVSGLLDQNDQLIRYALDSNEMCYISINQLENIDECKYLVAMPMRTSEGQLIGLFVVKEMSFWTLTDETLRILNMLTTYFVEETSVSSNIAHFLNNYPDCPIDFAKQLTKLIRLKKDLNIDSAFATLHVSKTLRPHNIIANLQKKRRFLDSIWLIEAEEYDILTTLMPFTNANGVQGFFNRITDFIKLELGLQFTQEQIKMRSMQLYPSKPEDIIAYYLKFIGIY